LNYLAYFAILELLVNFGQQPNAVGENYRSTQALVVELACPGGWIR